MANKITNTDNYTNIANAIRSKLGVQTTYTPAEMPAAIASITGGEYVTYTKTASTVDGIQFSFDELDILNGSVCKITIGQYVTTGRISQDNPTLYVITDIGSWLIFIYYFGHFNIGSTGKITQELYSWGVGSTSAPTAYTLSGRTTITFYVTPSQKQALDAL